MALRYCVRTKGKRAHLDQPGSCGKGQVYLEGAVDILQAVDGIDFHLLYSGKVRTVTPLHEIHHVLCRKTLHKTAQRSLDMFAT